MMDAEKLDQFRKSEGWNEFCKELDTLADNYRKGYDNCKTSEDFIRIQEKCLVISVIKQLPEILIERQGAQ